VAALINAPDTDSPELVRAARGIPPGSPAYESATYYAIDREIRSGHVTGARQWADRALAGRLSRSTRNLLLARRMRLAQNWNEFLKFAPRRPEPAFAEFEGKEGTAQEDPLPGAPFLLPDAAQILNRQTPLFLWLDAVRNPLTPRPLQLRLAFAGWLRAVMLDRYADARQFLQRVVELQPESAATAQPFLVSRDNDEARFAAVTFVLRAPSICPSAPYPELEGTNLARKRRLLLIGWYRSSCWGNPRPGNEDPPTPFLTVEQMAEGRSESARVYGQLPWEATVLLRETVAWTRKHPQDPRVPEALHDAVLAAYYRGTDPATGKYSKQAFDLLHQQYPKSPWAARTPYWYK